MNDAEANGIQFRKYFILIWVISLSYCMGHSIVGSIVSLYCDSLGFSTGFVGILSVFFSIFAVVTRFACGYMTDRLGRRWTMFIGCSIFTVSVFLFGIYTLPWVLVLMRGFHGTGFAICNTSNSAANVDVTPPQKLADGVGYLWIATAISFALGSNIALGLIYDNNFSMVFIVASCMVAIGAIASLFCNYEKKPGFLVQRPKAYEKIKLSDFFEKRAVMPAILVLFEGAGFGLVLTYLLLYAARVGIKNSGIVFMWLSASMVVFNIFCGRLARRFGVTRCLVVCLGLFAVGFMLLGVFPCTLTYYFCGIVTGIANGTVPLCYSDALTGIAYERRGAASSTILIATDIGTGAGAALWGFLLNYLAFSRVFIIAGFVQIIGVALTIFMRKRNLLKT